MSSAIFDSPRFLIAPSRILRRTSLKRLSFLYEYS